VKPPVPARPSPTARPRASPLDRLLDGYFRKFEQVYDERYQKRYGVWRLVIAGTVEKFLACGDPPQADFRAGAVSAVPIRVGRRVLLSPQVPVSQLSPEALPRDRRAHRP